MPKPVLNILFFCLLFSIEGFSGIFGSNLVEKNYLQAITQANAGKDTSICTPGLQLYANTPGADETGIWQILTGTGILSDPTIPNSIYSSSVNGVNVLSWSILNTITSELSIDTIIVTINPPPTIANAGVSVITCSSGLKLGGNTPVIGSGKWSVLSGSGNFINNTLGNTSVTGLSPGSNIYQWTITNASCKSVSTVSINFNVANAGPSQEVCIDNTFLNGNPPSVNNGQWTQTYPALIGDGSDPYFDDDLDPQTQIFQLRPGLNVLKWTTRNFSPNSCAASSLVTIVSNIVSTADAGTNQTVCGNSALLNAAPITLGTGTWSILTGAGANISNASLTNTTITNLPNGPSIILWSVTKGICYARDTVTVTNNSPSQATILSLKKPFICSDTVTLVAMAPSQGTGKWIQISGTATITAPNSLTTSLTGIPLGVSQYLWVVSFPGCAPSYDTVTVTRQNPETAQVQTHYLQMCNSNIITITGLNTTPGLGIWQTVTGNGIIANPNTYQTTISFSGIGRTKLQWQINITGCAPSIDTMTIDHNSVSIATVTGSKNQTICTDSLLLTGVNPAIGSGIWSFFSGTGTFLNATVSGTITKNLGPNRNILHWTVTNSFCSSFITVTITNNKPSLAQANPDKSICSTNDTLIAIAPTQGTGVWSVLTSTGIIGSGPANQKFISNLNLGKNSFLWTITKGTCKSYDTLNLTNKSPSPANILTVNDTLLCRNLIYLRSRTPIQGAGSWFNISGTGIIGASSINGTVTGTSITGLSYGQNIFSWSISVPGCAASMQTVTVNNHKVTIPSGNALDSCLSVASGNPAVIYLNANSSVNPGETATWRTIVSPGSTTYPLNTPIITVNGVGGSGFYKFGWKITDATGQCVSEDTVAIAVLPKALPAINQCLKTNSVILLNTTLTSSTSLKTSQGEYGSWSYVSANHPYDLLNASITVNSVTGIIGGLDKGVHTFYYTTRNSNMPACRSFDSTVVTVITKADVGNKRLCLSGLNYTTVGVNSVINTSVGGRGTWTGITFGTNISQSGSTSISADITIPTMAGVYKFAFTTFNINDLSCIDTDTLSVTNLSAPYAGIDTYTLTTTTSAQIKLNGTGNVVAIAGEIGNWTFTGAPAFIIDSMSNPKSPVHNLLPGINRMMWRITNTISGCSLQDTVFAYVQTKANAGANIVTLTSGLLTNVTITSPITLNTTRGETGSWLLVSTTGTTSLTSTAGSNIYTTGFNNLRRGAYLFRWTVSNTSIPGFTNTSDMHLTVMTKAITGTFCGVNDTLTVGRAPSIRISPVAGEIYNWSSPSIPGINPVPPDSTPLARFFNIPIGLSKLYLTITNTISNVSNKDSVFLTRITRPNAGTLPGVLLTSSTVDLGMNANAPNNLVGEIGYWSYYAPANVTPLPATLPNATATGLTPGVNPLVWTITNTLSGCSLKDTIKVLVQTIANAGSAIVFKNPNPAIAYTGTITSPNLLAASRGEYGKWTLVSTTAYSLPTSTVGSNMNTLNLANLRRGVSIFRWTVYNVSFPGSPAYSNSSDVDITVMTKAIADTNKRCITDSTNIILGNRPTVPIRPIGGEIFAWTSKPALPANSIIFTETDSIPLVTVLGLPMGQTKFYFSITSTGSGATDVDSVVITKVTNPDLGINITPFPLCDTIFHLQPINVPQTLTGESFQWQKLNGGSHFSNTSYNPYVSPLDTGNNTFKYTITNGTCIKSKTVTLRNNQPYLATITGANTSCFTSNPLQGNNPALQFKTATSEWLFVRQPKAIGSDTAIFQTPNQPSTIVNPMVLAGVYTFRYKVENMGCEILSDTFNIIRGTSISINPPVPYITICRNYFVMQAEPLQPNVTGTWTSLDIGLPDSVLHNPNFTLTGLGALSTGKSYRFYWNTRTDVCVNPPYPVTVVAFSKPSIATISQGDLPLSFCERDTISLSSVVPVGGVNGNHLWYVFPSGGGNFSNPLSGSTLVSNLRYGTSHIIYQVSTGDSCPVNRDTITIIRYQRTTNISIGSDSLVCGNIIKLNAEIPNVAGALARWSIISTLTAPISDPTDPKATITTSISGNYKLKWRVVNGACVDSSQITYKVREIPTRASVTLDTLPICDTSTYTLKGNIPVIGKGKWLSIGNSNRIVNDTLAITKTYITNYGRNWFAWVISNDFCNSSDTISITNSIPPTKAKAGEDIAVCSNEITLTGNNPTNGSPEWVMTNHTLTATPYTNSVVAKNLTAGPNTFIYKIQSPGCAPSLDSIIVTYNMATPAYAGRDTIICTDTLILNANVPIQGEGKWALENGSGKFEDFEDPKTRLTNIGNGANTYTWTITNGDCPASISKIKISNNKPSLVSFTQDKPVYKNTTELNGPIPINGTGKWLKLKGNGIIEEPANPTSTVQDLDIGENIFRWSVSNQGCDSIYFDQKITYTDIMIPDGFSPNNDAFNDKFKILGIEEYPGSKLEVFNRWGKLVYINYKYSPDTEWDGTDTKNEVLGNDTYFYVLTLPNQKIYKNSVLLTR